MLAAQGGHTETVKALIEAGADVNLGDEASFRSLPIIYQCVYISSIVLFH